MVKGDKHEETDEKSNIPLVFLPLTNSERQRYLRANEYLSLPLVQALQERVDWLGKHKDENLEKFVRFAQELHWHQLRNDEFKVFAVGKTFWLYNETRDITYQQAFY